MNPLFAGACAGVTSNSSRQAPLFQMLAPNVGLPYVGLAGLASFKPPVQVNPLLAGATAFTVLRSIATLNAVMFHDFFGTFPRVVV